jgi:hypothetical protein
LPPHTTPLATARADPSVIAARCGSGLLFLRSTSTGGLCLSRHERTQSRRRTHARHPGSDSFRCRHCRLDVPLAAPGTQHRNHCPNCLWSLHVDDDVPGDRAADCAGSMEPIGVSVRDDGEWALVHRCMACSTVHVNRIAGDDNPLMLMRLAVRPLALPPFPLEWLTRV